MAEINRSGSLVDETQEKEGRKGLYMSLQPNILFIISDQHNAKILKHKGHPNASTPHLVRLAAEGVRFDMPLPRTRFVPRAGSLFCRDSIAIITVITA